jgi:putative oxidoreductase
MKAVLSFLTLNFLPVSQDFGLLLLRAAMGMGMLFLHGWQKAQLLFGWGTWSVTKNHGERVKQIAAFSDPLHIGSRWSLSLMVFAEVLCSALLIVGFGSRFAAFVLSIAMGVAFFVHHRHALMGEGNGQLAAVYLAGFLVILFAGPGRFSFDGSGSKG